MSIGGFVRRTLFWLNNKEMFHAYKEISLINSMPVQQAEKITDIQLNKLLNHAINTTEYYNHIALNSQLKDFPVINKQTIIDNRPQMESSEFKGMKLHTMSTSGSTGIPFWVVQNSVKRMRMLAEIKALNDLVNYPSHEKMLYIIPATRRRSYSRKQQFKENIYRIPIISNDAKTMQIILEFILNKNPWAFHVPPGTLMSLISYIKEKNIPPTRFRIKTIITGGENIPEKLRMESQEVFGAKCKIVVKYSNEEMGILGIDSGICTPYALNVANYRFEILKMDSNEECAPGELGRIVITDLYNFALPMIRYDTGDIGSVCEVNGKRFLNNLSGKRRDLIFDVNGVPISGNTITNLLKYTKGVKLFQLIQEEQFLYRYKVVPTDDSVLPSKEDILYNELKNILGGEKADLILEFSDEIPQLSSQKRRHFINLYKPQ